MLAGKTIALGVTGGIAAYQMVELVARLRQQLADVCVIMTEAATKFITPLTLEVVSLHPVVVDMFSASRIWSIPHIALAKQADILLIAPATANIIGKIAGGIADDLLSTTVVASPAPVAITPAMNEAMWLNSIVQGNVRKLKDLGYRIIEPEYGEMACGGEGVGRLARLEVIISELVEISNAIEGVKGVKPRAD